MTDREIAKHLRQRLGTRVYGNVSRKELVLAAEEMASETSFNWQPVNNWKKVERELVRLINKDRNSMGEGKI